ncbi:hypothetical protein AND_009066 [Anopheles darlingi]|uniref:Uncharacterized protein n=1 Tax=Anopheles darlingi TaxID=43151 RepID=W5J4F5_ANODA|nr:hypothetical protein AND_009066 [Anopheles darlingi]
MATREKKARSLTSDSPTPFLVGSTSSGSNSNLTATTSTSTISPSSAGNGTTGNTLTLAETAAGSTSGGNNNSGASGSASAPTTPTSSRKGTITSVHGGSNSSIASAGTTTSGSNTSSNTRASLSRHKSKQQLLSSNTGDETGVTGEEPLVTGESSSLVTASPLSSTRTTRGGASRELETSPVSGTAVGSTSTSNTSSSNSDVSANTTSKDRDDMMPSPSWSSSSSKDRTKSPAVGARRAAAATKVATTSSTTTSSSSTSVVVTSTISTRADRRHQVKGSLKRAALLKRKAGRKIIGKPVLGKKGVVRRKLAVAVKTTRAASAAAAAAEIEKDSKSAKDQEMIERTTPSLRNGKPRTSDSPVPKRRAAQKSPDNSWPTSPSVKIERRRSVCVSKLAELDEESERQTDTDMKTKSFVLDKMSEAFNERKAPGGGSISPAISERGSSGSTLRRSTRQRKSTARDKEEFLSPRLKGAGSCSAMDIKMELVDQCDAGEEEIAVAIEPESISTSVATTAAAAPLTIDTTVVIDDDSIKDGPRSDGTVSIASTSGTGDVAVVVLTEAAASTGELVVEKDKVLFAQPRAG